MNERISRRSMISACINLESLNDESNLPIRNADGESKSKPRNSIDFLTEMIQTVKEYRELSQTNSLVKSSSNSKEGNKSYPKHKVKLVRSHNQRLYSLMSEADKLKDDLNVASKHIDFIVQRELSTVSKSTQERKNLKKESSTCQSTQDSSCLVQQKNSNSDLSSKSNKYKNEIKPTLLCSKRMINIEESAIKRRKFVDRANQSIDCRSSFSSEAQLNTFQECSGKRNRSNKPYECYKPDQKIQIMKLSLKHPKLLKQNRLLRMSKRRAKCVRICHNYISNIADDKFNNLFGKPSSSKRVRRTLLCESSSNHLQSIESYEETQKGNHLELEDLSPTEEIKSPTILSTMKSRRFSCAE